MSELEIYLWLVPAKILNCKYLEIKEVQRRPIEKWCNPKTNWQKAIFYLKMVEQQIISHKYVQWYNCITLWKIIGGEYYVHDKENQSKISPLHSHIAFKHVIQKSIDAKS